MDMVSHLARGNSVVNSFAGEGAIMDGASETEIIAIVRESLLRHYFKDPHYAASELGKRDLVDHLHNRLKNNRERIVPWIESLRSLAGTNILEIGCGTGASTLALAERGARVTAIDIRDDSIQVAMDRCKSYGYSADFLVVNATDVRQHLGDRVFDIVIFYASLEHMTHDERRIAMRDTWEMLPCGALWVVIETPNRLWYIDEHTAWLPFFHWLPDRVAYEYARFSHREYFRELYLSRSPESELHFLRRGRGLSFHEFELFIAPLQQLHIVSWLNDYLRSRDAEARESWAKSQYAKYSSFLQYVSPTVHPAFVEPYLDIAIRKP